MTKTVSVEKPAAKAPVVVSETARGAFRHRHAAPSAKLRQRLLQRTAANVTPVMPRKKRGSVAARRRLRLSRSRRATGERSLTRALGLKISRIVIDAGHGGHDTGTIGPHGLMEKDLCLDVALRLGKLIEDKASRRGSDLHAQGRHVHSARGAHRHRERGEGGPVHFIHANSSHDPEARGMETYYLNFATSAESMEVAVARKRYLAGIAARPAGPDPENRAQRKNRGIEGTRERYSGHADASDCNW